MFTSQMACQHGRSALQTGGLPCLHRKPPVHVGGCSSRWHDWLPRLSASFDHPLMKSKRHVASIDVMLKPEILDPTRQVLSVLRLFGAHVSTTRLQTPPR